jgi:ABC-2 type transport system permease protein
LTEEVAAQTRLSLVSASAHLLGLSLRRQFFSRQTLICVALSGLGCLIAWGWARKDPTVPKFAEEILVPVHASFLVPIFAICYGTTAVGGEREDRTLVYLLITPMPRPLVYVLKYIVAIALVFFWSAASLGLLAFVARPWGIDAARLFGRAILLGAAAYTSLFAAVGAAFRRGTIISLAYAFFLEGLLGNMPGIVKRISVSFYLKCMIYDAGAELNVGPTIARDLFLPIAGSTAATILAVIAAGLVAAGLVTFTHREYRDLS